MSGGTFDYNQYKITDIADEIQQRLDRQGGTYSDGYELLEYGSYPPQVQARLKEAVYVLRMAAIYAQRADWLFASDDNEESFLTRLDKELKALNDAQT